MQQLPSKVIIILLFSISGALNAQTGNKWRPLDSIRNALDTRPGFRVGLDGRNSFLNGRAVNIFGGRYGFDYGKVAVFTGLYSTNLKETFETDTILSGFRYMSSTLEYYLYQSWRYEIVSSFQVGYGTGYRKTYSGGETKNHIEKTIMPVETGIGGTVRFLRYLGFCAGIGIRMSTINGQGFSGSYYYYGLTFFTGTMYRDAKKLFNR